MGAPEAPPLPKSDSSPTSSSNAPVSRSSPRRGYTSVATATKDMWERLFDEGYRADVDIVTNDHCTIHAHANILGMASPVMKNMLKKSRKKDRPSIMSIRGVPHQAVRVFIRYLYSSCYEQEEMDQYVLPLLVLSHVFVVPSFKRECEQELESHLLNEENHISATEGWKVMKKSHPSLEKELLESVIEADTRKQEKMRKTEEKRMYLQLYEAMEALVHICRDGCQTIGPHDKVLKGKESPCNYSACKGLELLVRHFAGCKLRVPGGCVHCKRMWQLLELHSRLCYEPNVCRVPLCRNFKERMQQQGKKDEMKWKMLVKNIVRAKNIAGAPFFSSAIEIDA
ncbi:BTB/POZ and TAZ domain-containing protein 4 [Ranunculus cassubicifolius]